MSVDQTVNQGEVTRLLRAAVAGDAGALDRLVPLVYDELLRLAHRQLAREHGSQTLQTTALVHEAYLKLLGGGWMGAADRPHFLAIAARAMRQVLVDFARRRKAAKRGGGMMNATLSDGDHPVEFPADDLLALDRALEQLDSRQRQIVECRFFGGMEESDIAAALGISERTVRRDWVKARAWLHRSLNPAQGG
jgi:RNA polymerase sigma factor (TIGR02999 family)